MNMYAKKNSGKKVFAMLLALALVVGCGIGGTIAWLMDTTDAVTNTFTVGDVDIEVDEEKVNPDGTPTEEDDDRVQENNYHLLPGQTYHVVLKNAEGVSPDRIVPDCIIPG